VIPRTSLLLSNDRSGFRSHTADDTKGAGHYHVAVIDSERVSEAIPFHRFAKQIKHYHVREGSSSVEGALSHPKVGVRFHSKANGGTISWDDAERLERELDEWLLNSLSWAGIEIEETAAFVADDYFSADTESRQRRIVEDPLPSIADQQENVVITHLRDGLNDSDLDVLETLVTDGGDVSPSDVADDTEWHLDTIYAAVNRLEGMVEHEYDSLSLRSNRIAELVTERVRAAEEALIDAAETSARVLERADAIDRASDALVEWCERHGISISDRRDGQLAIRAGRVGSRDRLEEILRDGLLMWINSGYAAEEFRNARVEASVDNHRQIGTATAFGVSATT
jgi:hypothetical protein